MRKVYDDVDGVEKSLKDQGINTDGRTILIPKNMNVGIKTWGKIDYLCHHCGYNYIRLEG